MTLCIKCPTCDGQGKVNLEIEEKDGQVWTAYRGDKDLWDRYSHASIRESRGTWSNFFPIASFYRSDGDLSINFYGGGGSWPVVSLEEIKKDFRFIDRKTGEEIPFDEPKLKSLEETIEAMMKCDSKSVDRMETLVRRLGFEESSMEIIETMQKVKQTLDTK